MISADLGIVGRVQMLMIEAKNTMQTLIDDMRRSVNNAGATWDDVQFERYQANIEEFVKMLQEPMSDMLTNAGKLEDVIINMREYLEAK